MDPALWAVEDKGFGSDEIKGSSGVLKRGNDLQVRS